MKLISLWSRWLCFVCALAVCYPAAGLNIIGDYIGNGQSFSSQFSFFNPAGPPASNVAGGGSLTEIFDTAAEWWETAIADNFTVNVEYGWTSGVLGTSAAESAFPTVAQPTFGAIGIDNNGPTINFFADSTPRVSEEWNNFTSTSSNLGGGTVNTGRVYSSPLGGTGASGRNDLLTIFLHELGHILGVNPYGPNSFSPIQSPLPFAGTSIPNNTIHFTSSSTSSAIMYNPITTGTRHTLSAIDILAVAQHGGYTDVTLDPSLDAPAVVGDYDGNGFVDEGDYNKWLADFGQTGPGLAADGNMNGMVDEADYTLWLNNIGATDPGTIGAGKAIPEPGTLALIAVILLVLISHDRRRLLT